MITFSLLLRNLTGKSFGLPTRFFMQVWENCISPLYRNIWRRIWWKKNILSFLDNQQKLSACTNSILHVLMNFAYCENFVSFLSKDFQQDCQNWIVFRGSFQWSFFWKNVYFSKILFLERIFSVFGQKSSSRVARTELYVSTRKLGRKVFCWKNCVCAILFQKWVNNFGPLAKFFSSALWKLLLLCP